METLIHLECWFQVCYKIIHSKLYITAYTKKLFRVFCSINCLFLRFNH